ncbi:hypothetical protein [Actinomadura opuntiae]|uniref:hypothetical protein n=1 Tax=Actinomadura sp. OS1-43 TaxID=604315 RepID=UPI00255AF6C2|nr:hypothetical protein [Actinomadura sp. OS1-43]MDL4815295.1 hypothetical protein [Actinomadura sp. OS1-43]
MSLFDEIDLEDLSTQAPWPSATADLHAEDPDWWYVACLGWSHDGWLGYVSGYRKAAGVLVEHMGRKRQHLDILIFPFLMCWRHYVELQLKALIGLLQKYEGEAFDIPRGHKVDQLWRDARRRLERAGVEEAEDLDHVERVLLQLSHLDPTAQSFRYPIDVKGHRTLEGTTRLHTRRFQEAMEAVANFLDAADTGFRCELDVRTDYQADMEAYYRDAAGW